MYVSLIFLLSVAFFGCTAGANDYDLLTGFTVPNGAYDVKKLRLAKETQQLFFQITESYPSTRVIDSFRSSLSGSGWMQCTTSGKQWVSYEDRSSGGQPLLVHKLADYWIHAADSKLLILSAIYYSKDLSKSQPDNEEQRLIVWVQRVRDLDSELSKLGIHCEKRQQ